MFEKACPLYMSYGMTYDEFWNGNSYVCRYYRDAYELKKKAKDEELWMQGLYIYDALGRMSPIMHAFPKKGSKPLPYPDRPYTQSTKYKEVEKKLTPEEQEQIVKNERLKARLRFDAWARGVNKMFKTEESKNQKEGK